MRRFLVMVAAVSMACGGGSGAPGAGANVNAGAGGNVPGSAAGSGGTTGAGAATDFATFCQGTLDGYRALVTSCLHGNAEYVTAVTTVGFFDCGAVAKEIAAGRVAYDAVQAGTCSATLASSSCTALGATSLPAACQAALTGTVTNGAACFADEDCSSSSSWCDSTLTCPGTCRPFAAVNASCASNRCAPGLECDAAQICRARSGLNGACPCDRGLWCDTSTGAAGTCRAPQTSGACKPTTLDQCAAGHVCAGAPSTCQALVGAGGDCSGGSAVCGLGYVCDLATRRCVAPPRLGDACTPSNPICIGGYCDVSGTLRCTPYKRMGDPCSLPEDGTACEPGSACHADAGSSRYTCKPFQVCQAP